MDPRGLSLEGVPTRRWVAETAMQPEGTRWKRRRSALRDPLLVERILELHAVRPALRPILDAPCGTGRLREVLERRGMRYVGVDASSAMLREASLDRRGARAADEAISPGLCLARVERLPFRDDAFDVVLCCRLLHHLDGEDELRAILAELTRVAHRLVIASFWDAASLPAWRQRVGLRKRAASSARHAVSKSVLRALFHEAGAEVQGFHHSFRFVSQQAFVVARKRVAADERKPQRAGLLEVEFKPAPSSLRGA